MDSLSSTVNGLAREELTEQKKVKDFMMEPEKIIQWDTGWTLSGYTLTKKEDGWLMTIKVTSGKGVRKVAFIHTNSVYNCWAYLYKALTTTGVRVKWRDDRFA